MNKQQIMPVIRRYADAWLAGDAVAIVACYHDDFTLHYPGDHALSGMHAGKLAALTVLAQVGKRTNRRPVAIIDVLAGETRGAMIARERWQVGDDTAEIERVFVYTVRDGLLVECWLYDADQAVVARFMNREVE